MNMPVGLRSAHAQVQNYELRLAKANKALEFSEEEIAQELAVAFQEISRTYAVLQSNHNRYLAAMEYVSVKQTREGEIDVGDEALRGLIRRAEAQRAYHESLIDYNKSITNLYYRKGTILAYNNIQMSEGGWSPSAYQDASRLHGRRAYGHEIDVEAEPAEFVLPASPGHVDFTTFPTEPTAPQPTTPDQPINTDQ